MYIISSSRVYVWDKSRMWPTYRVKQFRLNNRRVSLAYNGRNDVQKEAYMEV